MRLTRVLNRVLLASLMGGVPGIVTNEAQGARRPAVLFTCGVHSSYLAVPLHDAGIEIHTGAAKDLPNLLPSGRFNVVVVASGFGDPAVEASLRQFMAAGGGVMVLPCHVYMYEKEYLGRQEFLKQYGATFAVANVLERDTNRCFGVSMGGLFLLGSVAPPFAAGVRGLMMHQMGPESYDSTVPPVDVRADTNWTPVVKGSATAESVPFAAQKVAYAAPYVPKTAVKEPVLLAVRDAGAGRLAARGVSPEWRFSPPANCPPVEAILGKGAGGKPSDWIPLLANVFRHLAEPSLRAGRGGEPTPAAVLNPVRRWENAAPVDWTRMSPIADQGQLPALVGARSSYSGGKGSVDEWAQAAKAAGLKVLVFLEPLDAIRREDFAKLKADCARCTDSNFWVCAFRTRTGRTICSSSRTTCNTRWRAC